MKNNPNNTTRFIIALAAIMFGGIFLIAGPQVSAQDRPDNPVVQTGEGVGKIVTSPVKVPEDIADDAEKKDPVSGVVTGTVKGTAEGVEQIGKGTEEVIESPLKIFK
jgi:hypothetical protein